MKSHKGNPRRCRNSLQGNESMKIFSGDLKVRTDCKVNVCQMGIQKFRASKRKVCLPSCPLPQNSQILRVRRPGRVETSLSLGSATSEDNSSRMLYAFVWADKPMTYKLMMYIHTLDFNERNAQGIVDF